MNRDATSDSVDIQSVIHLAVDAYEKRSLAMFEGYVVSIKIILILSHGS